MISNTKIIDILRRIEIGTDDQVINGQQNDGLPDDHRACGQFFKFKDRSQRGLHGSAAALKILSISDNQAVKRGVPYIVNYLTSRLIIADKENVDANDNFKDRNNVIKVAECLFSLNMVKSAVADTERIKSKIIDSFRASIIDGAGWSYSLDDLNRKELLPTSFVALSLFSVGYKDSQPIYDYIISELEEIEKDRYDLITFTIMVFSLYVLAFYYDPIKDDKVQLKRIKKLYKGLWKSEYCIFNQDIEQNIEYWRDDKHSYIRVPWQLYMLALSSKFSPWNFSKIACQERLSSIYDKCVNGDGFRYPYSGAYFSIRTHSIIYETLINVKGHLKQRIVYDFFSIIDYIRNVLASRYFRLLVSLFSFSVACYFVYNWWNGKGQLQDLVPELLGPVFVGAIMLGKKK
jgi:hypothetical protein